MDASDGKYDREEGEMSEHPVVDSPGHNKTPRVVVLPDNQIAVIGSASSISEKLKEAGGEYNRSSHPARGWLFSADKMDTVNQIIAEVTPPGEPAHAQGGSSEAVIPHAPMDVMTKYDADSSGAAEIPPAHATRSHSSQHSVGEGAGISHAEAGQPSSSSHHADDVAHATRSHGAVEEPAQTTMATEAEPTATSSGPASEHAQVDAEQISTAEPAPMEQVPMDLVPMEQAHITAPSTQGVPAAGPVIVQLTTRTIGVLGNTDAYNNELKKITGAKFNKVLNFGDGKVPGWSFAKKHLSDVQKIIPGVQILAQGGGMKAGGGAQGSTTSPISPGGRARKKQRLEQPSASQQSVPKA